MGRPDDAIEAFRRALSIEPNEKLWLHSLARALRLAGDPDEALAVLQQALELGEDGEVLATMGQVLAELGSPDALAVLERAIDVEPTAGAFASIASVLIADDDAGAASGVLDGALERFPGEPELLERRAFVRILLEERDLALEDLDAGPQQPAGCPSPPDARSSSTRTGDPKTRSRRSVPPLRCFPRPVVREPRRC